MEVIKENPNPQESKYTGSMKDKGEHFGAKVFNPSPLLILFLKIYPVQAKMNLSVGSKKNNFLIFIH